MTDAEAQQLRALGDALADAEQSRWEPRCVTRAFASADGALALTMQGWIDLEAVRSPLLQFQLPDGDDTIEQYQAAARAFGLPEMEVTPEGLLALGKLMLAAMRAAFEPRLAMREAGAEGAGGAGGFGVWLPILACLVAQLGLSRVDALQTPVAQACALIAGHRCNQGWELTGPSYAQRDALEGKGATDARD